MANYHIFIRGHIYGDNHQDHTDRIISELVSSPIDNLEVTVSPGKRPLVEIWGDVKAEDRDEAVRIMTEVEMGVEAATWVELQMVECEERSMEWEV